MEKISDIELRSEKARNLVGKMPPLLLRSGISVIAGVMFVIIGLLYFIPYPQTTDLLVKIDFEVNDSTYYAVAQLPITQARMIKVGQETITVVQGLRGDYSLSGEVVNLCEDNGSVLLRIKLLGVNGHKEHLRTSPDGKTTIYISRTPVLKRIII